jgi:hypothetical protein
LTENDKYCKERVNMYTYLILGQAYSISETVDITFNINDTILYSGKIAASPWSALAQDTMPTELYRWNTDSPLQGDLSVSGSVADGDLFFANFEQLILTSPGVPDTPAEEIVIGLEYPDSHFTQHAVTNLVIDEVVQPVPTNISKPETPGDIRGWNYRIPNGSVFRFNYFAGPFADNV